MVFHSTARASVPLLLLGISLISAGCMVSRGGGGGGGDDDDDSAPGDDDTDSGDDDTSSGDDDTSSGDDDTGSGDDDTGSGDDDDTTGSQIVTVSSGSMVESWDFSADLSETTGWADCSRTVSLVPNTTTTLESGCPSCIAAMVVDSGTVTVTCDSETGITDAPITGMQFGVTNSGSAYYWNYEELEWSELAEGSTGSSSFSGSHVATGNEYTHDDGNVYTYDFQRDVEFSW